MALVKKLFHPSITPLLLFCIILGGSSVSWAQEDDSRSSYPELSEELLFELEESQRPFVLVTSANLDIARELIVPELVSIVDSGEIEMPVIPRLNFSWRRSDEWEAATSRRVGLKAGEVNYYPTQKMVTGFPFGRKQNLLEDENAARVARRILWNLQSNFWSQGATHLAFNLVWLQDEKLQAAFNGHHRRLYPHSTAVVAGGALLFRERFKFTAPRAVANFSWLSFRFVGSREDMLWIHSPAIGKTREVTGLNRLDPFFRTVLTPDDWFTWSGKLDQLEVKLLGTMNLLAPFPQERLVKLPSRVNGCVAVPALSDLEILGEQEELKWNFERRRFFQGAGWLPNKVIYAPREMFRIEIMPHEPYSTYGRQVLYVDSESMLPLYKIVYDKSGQLYKLVMSAFAYGITEGKREKVFFPYLTVVHDFLQQSSALVRFVGFKYCNQPSAEFGSDYFDPGHLAGVDVELIEEQSGVEGVIDATVIGVDRQDESSQRVPGEVEPSESAVAAPSAELPDGTDIAGAGSPGSVKEEGESRAVQTPEQADFAGEGVTRRRDRPVDLSIAID